MKTYTDLEMDHIINLLFSLPDIGIKKTGSSIEVLFEEPDDFTESESGLGVS